jgi:hypothetical protein
MRDEILNLFLTLPHSIDYVGFRFQLVIYEDFNLGPTVKYFLSECLSKKQYKKNAFKEKHWFDKNPNRAMDSMYTNFFIQQPIFDISDEGLKIELEAIRRKLELWGIIKSYIPMNSTEYEEITENIPHEGKTLIEVFEDGRLFEKDEFERYASI